MLSIEIPVITAGSQDLTRSAAQARIESLKGGGLIGPGVSTIPGYSAAGEIHSRFLHADPGSATAVLKKYSDKIDWMAQMFKSVGAAATSQDLASAIGLDNVGNAYAAAGESVVFESEPDSNYGTLSFLPPRVVLMGDLNTVVGQVANINLAAILDSSARWASLAAAAEQTVASLTAISGQIAGANSGAAIDAGVARIAEAIGSGQQFAANATMMSGKTAAMAGLTSSAQLMAMVQAAAVNAIPVPAARLAMAESAKRIIQAQLQAAVDASLPGQGSLMAPLPSAGGGSATIGTNGTAEVGEEQAMSEVRWPQKLVDAVARGQVGPGSFEVVDGQLRPVANVGMSEADAPIFDKAVRESLGQMSRGVQSPDFVRSLQDVVTSAASVPAPSVGGAAASLPAGVSGMSGFGSSPLAGGNAGHGLPNNVSAPAGMTAGGAPVGIGGAGTTGTSGLGANHLSNAAAMAGAGMPMNGANPSGTATGRGAFGNRLGGMPVGAGSRLGAAGGHAAGGIGGGVGGVGAGRGIGGVGGGVPHTGSSTGGQAPGALRDGAGAGHAASASAGSGGKQGARMMPLMGAPARGDQKDRGTVKTVTSQVEADPNRKALLGQLPPAVPGVIGAWVRD